MNQSKSFTSSHMISNTYFDWLIMHENHMWMSIWKRSFCSLLVPGTGSTITTCIELSNNMQGYSSQNFLVSLILTCRSQ
jgi:hypothetical protein